MQKQEFEERIERTVTDEQYKVIEEVYMWHPSIRNTSGKDEVAELYKSFGMTIFHVTLGEAAELERVKYNTMVKRVLRKQESFVTKTEKSENGGKDVVLVAVSSLSKQARNAWKEREKLKSFTEEFPDKKEDEQKPEVPWYVNTDVDWYIENYKERYYKAVELGNVVRKFLQYDEGDRTKYAEEFAQKYLGKGQRTLYRYTKAWKPCGGCRDVSKRNEMEHNIPPSASRGAAPEAAVQDAAL